MTRPRMVAVISAISSSTAAFLVVSRGGLFGTVAGAVLFALVYALVSHWASEGLDHVSRLLRRYLRRGGVASGIASESSTAGRAYAAGPAGAEPRTVDQSPEGGPITASRDATKVERPNRPATIARWALVGSTLAALALSVYTLASPPPMETVETVVVRERVVEKTLTVAAQQDEQDESAQASYAHASNAGTSDVSSSNQDITDTGPSTTMASAPAEDGSEPSTTATAVPTTTETTGPSPISDYESATSTAHPAGDEPDTTQAGTEPQVSTDPSQP